MKKQKKIVAVMIMICLTLSCSGNVLAYNLLGYKLNGGVGNWGYTNRYYWIDSSLSSRTSTINNAYSSWIHTSSILSTPISWKSTSVKTSGTVEFFAYNADNELNAYTTYYRKKEKVKPTVENWGWCTIDYNMRYDSGQATIAHEIGHTMGLAHNEGNPYSIMCTPNAGRMVSTPQYDDLAGINALYN